MAAASASATGFGRAPLRYLDEAFHAAGECFRLPGGVVCVAEPAAAKEILRNDTGRFHDHSDFYATRYGVLGPRSAQLEIDRASRTLLYGLPAAEPVPEAVAALGSPSDWPDAGNRLVHRLYGHALLAPDRPPGLRSTVDTIVERAVLAGARDRRSRLGRAWFRTTAMRELARATSRRPATAADLLDVVVRSAPAGTPARQLAEVYLGFVFALAGSVGFLLGWSVYLLGTRASTQASTRPDAPAAPDHVVREALRLWPVAWLLGRRPVGRFDIRGTPVAPRDEVLVCPYLVHRHPGYWSAPEEFRPERWAGQPTPSAFLPFGWGPHTCAAAAWTVRVVEDLLRHLTAEYAMTVTPLGTGPQIGAALAPPPFQLHLRTRRTLDGRR